MPAEILADLVIPVSDIEIYRSAHALIQKFGGDAAARAAMKADECYEAGDLRGYVAWRRIVQAVNILKSMKPAKAIRK